MAIAIVLVASIATVTYFMFLQPSSQTQQEVNIGLVKALSGTIAYSGASTREGNELAIEDINANGGIKSLGGAKLVGRFIDSGSTAESASSALTALLGTYSLSGIIGPTSNALSLACGPVAEFAKVPFVDGTYADDLVNKGYNYTYKMSQPQVDLYRDEVSYSVSIIEDLNITNPLIALCGDNTPMHAPLSSLFRGYFAEQLPSATVVYDEMFNPGLSDATPIILKIIGSGANFMILYSSAAPDVGLILRGLKEHNYPIATIGLGGSLANPTLLTMIPKEQLEAMMVILAYAPLKGVENLTSRLMARTQDPFIWQAQIIGYAEVMILYEAIEKAGSTDPKLVNNALKTLHLDPPSPACILATENRAIQFNATTGQMLNTHSVLCQWQDGVPYAIYPPSDATKAPISTLSPT